MGHCAVPCLSWWERKGAVPFLFIQKKNGVTGSMFYRQKPAARPEFELLGVCSSRKENFRVSHPTFDLMSKWVFRHE